MSQLTLNADTTGYVTLSVAASVTSYTFQLPSAAPGTSGSILTSTTGGVASWTATGTGVATALGVNVGSAGAFLTTNTTNTLTVGYTVTPYSIGTVSSGTTTPNPADGNYQYLTNGGAFTLAAPTSDCAIDIMVINGASSGAITLSGFKTAGTNVGGNTYATTNSTWWILSVRRVNGVSTYNWSGPWT